MEILNIKKIFLYSLIASITISALVGIWVILLGEFGDFQSRVLLTTLTIVGTSILGLACGAFLENPKSQSLKLKFVPMIGIILSVFCAGLILLLTWEAISSQNDAALKTIAITGIWAFSLSQLSLLSLANLSKQFMWSLVLTYFVVLTLATIISVLIVIEPSGDNDYVMRLIGVLAIGDAALTIIIPVFHRLSRNDFKKITVTDIDLEIEKLKAQIESLEQQKEDLLKK